MASKSTYLKARQHYCEDNMNKHGDRRLNANMLTTSEYITQM